MFTKKRVLTVSAIALSAALSHSAMAAQTTMEVIDELDAQQSQIDDNHAQLARQQAEIDRLRSRLRAEIIDAPARFLAMDRNDDGMLTKNEVGRFVEFASVDTDNNGSVTVEEWKDRLPPRRMRIQ